MRSKTSSFNKEIIKQDFRNVGWVGIVYFLGIFFLAPLQLFMDLSRMEPQLSNYNRGSFGGIFGFDMQIIFLFLLPVLMAIFIFRYLHVRGASDFAHSFPLKRGNLFNHHIIAGLVLLLVPILLNYLILLISAITMDVSDYYSIIDLSYWLWLMSFITILIFMSSVFIGTLTGLSAVQGLLTYIFLLFPAGIYVLVAFHISSYIDGFSGDVVLNRFLEKYSPLINVVEYPRGGELGQYIEAPVEPTTLIIYGIAAGVLYAASFVLYNKRPLEAASKAIAVTALQPFFKYGVTFCFALFWGMYFGSTQHSHDWMIAGYVIGGAFGYLIAVMLLEKTWRVFNWRHLKGWIVYGLGAGILIAILPLFWQNYEAYIPAQSEIKQVYVGNGYYQYESGEESEGEDLSFITSSEAIDAVRSLHGELIENSSSLDSNGASFFIAYQLDNGEEVLRRYQVDREKVTDSLKKVYEMDEYKNIRYQTMNLDPAKIQKVMMHPRINHGQEQTVLDSEKIGSFMEVLKADLYNLSYDQMVAPRGLDTNVAFMVEGHEANEGYPSISIYPSYTRTMDWLKSEGLYEDLMVQAGDVEVAEVYRWQMDIQYRHNGAHFAYNQLKSEGVEPLTVTDSPKVEELLKGRDGQQEGEYIIALFFDENNPDNYQILSFDAGEAPDFIKEHFE
ncbi:DUF6449 domain-containing protein [Halobacillus sp. H74]|uniref:DUF6449 domain-containing protein n=1 Tax=Halobacillus sp. H74 TaxID=3457436 RepID=UPI003FCEDEFC